MEPVQFVEDNEVTNDLLVFGLVLGFAAEFWVGMGNIQIKYSHKLDAVSSIPRSPYKRGRWWLGFILLVLNSIFNFGSYMFASLNVLAPTSALVIIINAVFAYWYFGEKLTLFGILGSLLIMIGCSFSILYGTHDQDELRIEDLFIAAKTRKFILFTSIHAVCCIIFGIIGNTKLRQKHMIINTEQSASEIELINNESNINYDDSYSNDNDVRPLINELITPAITSAPTITSSSVKKAEFKYILRCFLLGFSTAGVIAWLQFLGKIAADLVFESLFHGNNQFSNIKSWIMLAILGCVAVFGLLLLSEIMRIFDAVLIVPIYNSLLILSSMALSSVYFDNFMDFTIVDTVMFTLGLIFIFSGIGAISYGQTYASMEHHERDIIISSEKQNTAIDRREYLSNDDVDQ